MKTVLQYYLKVPKQYQCCSLLSQNTLGGFVFYNGFIIYPFGGESDRILGHSGGVLGFISHLIIDIDRGIGMVVVDVRTINEHIKKILADGELADYATIRNFRIVQNEGSRMVMPVSEVRYEKNTAFVPLDATFIKGIGGVVSK